MFMSNAYKKDEIRNIAIQELRSLGIKYRPKKAKPLVQEPRSTKRVFKTALGQLPTQTVTLGSGQQLVVPKLVHELCSFVLTNAQTEGLFRKGGSKSRQNEIKLLLDAGCRLGDEHHEVDVANVLKTFLRELPEPLVPYSYHDLFLRSVLLEKKVEGVLLSCLLLPAEHLNTLAYFMQFLQQIADKSEENKMDAYNLAVVIGPTVFPIEEKLNNNSQYRLQKTCELFKLLVENAEKIGILPDSIIDTIEVSSSPNFVSQEDLTDKKKKKRRSGSLTRIMNGLKKIVSSKSLDEPLQPPPDLLNTPKINRSGKKRRAEGNFSNKRKKDVLSKLPEGALRTPMTPSRTPISVNPNPKRKNTPESAKIELPKEKKSSWYAKTKVKQQSDALSTKSESAKSLLERRWSAVSHAASFKKGKKKSSSSSLNQLAAADPKPPTPPKQQEDPDYVKISKTEYEEIKNRVSAIERRISLELDIAEQTTETTNVIERVQTEYEKTLVQVEPLSPTTDHLARRFSRELKIRRSAEQKVHRSPSARKIGTIRRRSREKQTRITRNQSWHVATAQIIPRASVRRRSAIQSLTSETNLNAESTKTKTILDNSDKRSSMETWTSGETFTFSDTSEVSLGQNSVPSTGRSSLARLRSQNAGMVMAKARLFDDINALNSTRKIGSVRSIESRLRVQQTERKSTSPLKRRAAAKQRILLAVQKENLTKSPATPCIKKPLTTKSPKRLCRTPKIVDRGRTPLRAARVNY